MSADDATATRRAHLEPSPTDAEDLALLGPALKGAGYTEEGLGHLMDLANFVLGEMPATLWRCGRDGSARARLAALLLLNENLGRADIERILGAANVETLARKGILRARDQVLTSMVDLFPCERAWVCTDHAITATREKTHVYELGADSYILARMAPRRPVGRALDLCTGSGIHAILAAFHAEESTGVDINPRALAFSQVNAALNGVHGRCRFVEGDLYEAVPGRQFDLIVTNPPWIATPDSGGELYRWGGETGEVITQRIVEGAATALAPDGTLAMYAVYPVFTRDPYVERIRRWLGGGPGWGVGVVNVMEYPLSVFVRQHMEMKADWGEYIQEYWKWLDMLAKLGIESMRCAMVYVRRLGAEHAGWSAEKWAPMPKRSVAPAVTAWLDAQDRAHAPDGPGTGPEWRPRVSDETGRLMVDLRGSTGRADGREAGWGPARDLDADEVRLLRLVDGTHDVESLAVAWAEAGGGTDARETVLGMLRRLVAAQVVR